MLGMSLAGGGGAKRRGWMCFDFAPSVGVAPKEGDAIHLDFLIPLPEKSC